MNEKLTLSDCFKYPNAKVLKFDNSNCETTEYKNLFDYIYSTAYFDGANIQKTSQEDFDEYYLPECQLILRPKDSLTVEEKLELADIICDDNNPEDYIQVIENLLSKKGFEYDGYFLSEFVSIFDKLTKWNVDYRGFIESRKAVEQ